MPRSPESRADETVTVRIPRGTADKVRAATGQPFSTVVRWMVVQLLNNYAEADESVKEQLRKDVQRSTAGSISGAI